MIKSRSVQVLSLVFAILLSISLIGFSGGGIVESQRGGPGYHITWSPSRVSAAVSPGGSWQGSVSFVSSIDLAGAELSVVPELAPFVSVEPMSFPTVVAGTLNTVQVHITIPDDAEPDVAYEGTIRLRVGRRTYPQPLKVNIYVAPPLETITEESYNATLALEEEAGQMYWDNEGEMGAEQAKQVALGFLRQQDEVFDAGVSEGGSIWVVYKDGIHALISTAPEGTLGGGEWVGDTGVLDDTVVGEASGSIPGSTQAVLICPIRSCPKMERWPIQLVLDRVTAGLEAVGYDVDVVCDDDVTVDMLKSIYSYGVVGFLTHGEVLWGQVLFMTGEEATAGSFWRNRADVVAHRLTRVWDRQGNHWYIRPSFVTYYAVEPYPNSIVVATVCRGFENRSMADAFLDAGACVYAGWTDLVAVPTGIGAMSRLFEELTRGKTMMESLAAIANDELTRCPLHGAWFIAYPVIPGDCRLFLPGDEEPDQFTLTISSTFGGSVTRPGEGTFTYDASWPVVSLRAEVDDERCEFLGWTGDVDTIADVSDPRTTITMKGDYSITAEFGCPPDIGRTFQLSVSSTDGGSVTTPGEGTFNSFYSFTWGPEVVDLVATPESGYRFVNWTGDVGTIADVSAASTTITMDGNYSITANFEEVPTGQYTLTISSTDAGLVTTPGEGTFTYDAGAVVDLAAEVDWCSWLFYQWTGDVDTLDDVYDAATTIVMNGDYSISASFDHPGSVGIFPWVSVWICSTDGGSVTTPYEGEVQTEIGAVEDLVATPDSGYRFVNWTGTVETVADVNAASTTITMDSTYYITAVFEEEGEEEPEYLPMVAAGHRHILGLMFDGTVVALGNNEYGQCDVGTWTDIIQVAAGSYHTVGLKSDGTVVAVGWNHHGQCDVDIWTDIIQVTAGGGHTAGLKSDGTVVATGNNNVGQCDVGGWTDIMQVVAGHSHTVGLKSDGTVVAIGYTASELNASGWTDIVQLSAGLEHTVGLKSNGTVVAVGRNSWGQCDVDTWTDIVQIAAGRSSTVGLMCDGSVIATGYEHVGTLDVGDWTEITQVAAGGSHIVGLKSDGTVIAVGVGFSGQWDVGTWTDIIQVSQGSGHTLGLKSDGTVVAVGSNYWGQCDVDTWTDIVGIAAGYSHTVAVRSDGTVVAAGPDRAWHVEDWTDIVQVAAGKTHTIGLKANSTVVAAGVDADDWGDWLGGEWPIIEEWTDIVQVAAGEDHAVGLKSNGAVLAAGSNLHGECNVQDWTDIVKLAAGGLEIDDVPNGATRGHTLGLRSNGTVVATGYDGYGQLEVADWTDITDIAAGHWHTVGLKSDGTVVAAGYDSYGQCNVDGWTDIIQVAAGGWITLGLTEDGTVVAAGAEIELARWNLGETAPPPIEIWDWYDLDAIRDNLSGDYVLMRHLDSTTAGYEELAGPTANDGKGWAPIGVLERRPSDEGFAGVFDGQHYEIRDLFINRPWEREVGLFCWISEQGVIRNVGVVNANVTSWVVVGGLAGLNSGGTVSNCHFTGSVTVSHVGGGLLGSNGGTVINCYSRATVIGGEAVGGLVAYNWGDILDGSFSTGSVIGQIWAAGGLVAQNMGTVADSHSTASVIGEYGVGGLVGDNCEAIVSNCYSTGSVTGLSAIGGLVGYNWGTASHSYSTGSVSGSGWDVGGLVGHNAGAVANCYARGNVVGDNRVGGLAGDNDRGVVNRSYSTGSVTGNSYVGGLIGHNDYGFVTDSFWDVENSGMTWSGGGTGKTTAEMMDIITFTDTAIEGLDEPWDIVVVGMGETNAYYTWNIVDGQTYPFLSAGKPPSEQFRFAIGDWVQTTANLNVREGPGLGHSVIRTMPLGAIAQVLAGPILADGFLWWKLEYAVGVVGWSVENWLELHDTGAPICVVRLQTDGVQVDEIGVWEFFDIYVGQSISESGIKQVRFSSDHVRDGYPTGRWTDWFDWNASRDDWDAETKVKRWAFDTPGYKEVWAQVKDDSGHIAFGLATILVPAPALPVLTSPLSITPVKDIYNVGDVLEARFTIKNIGHVPITFDVLTVGGRLNGFIPSEGAPDFTFRSVTLLPNVSYEYQGSLTLDQRGQYRFFVAFQIENPTQDERRLLDENNWNTCIELGNWLIHTDRVKSIMVYEEDTVADDVALLRKQIDGLKNVSAYIPPYLLNDASFGGSVATLWMYWKSFATDSWEAYDMHYFAGLDYNYLRVKSLVLAEDALDLGDLEQARRLVQMSFDYGKLSTASFQGAFLVYDRNVEQAQAVARFVKDRCQAVVVAGVSALNPTAGKLLDYGFLCTDYLINRHLLGEEEAKKILIRDGVVKAFFDLAPIFDGKTLSDYTKAHPSFQLTQLRNYIVNSETLPDILYDVIRDYLVDEAFEVVKGLADNITEMLSSAIEYEVSKVFSPVQLRVRDSQGRTTGLMNGEVRHEIPGSMYSDGGVTVFFPLDIYCYEMAGTDEGNYGLRITRVDDDNVVMFTATDIPTSAGAVHLYTINWDALAQGEDGVTVQVDADGDGVFERTIIAGSELTGDEFMPRAEALVTIDPRTLNLQARGEWITASIGLPEEYAVEDINVDGVHLSYDGNCVIADWGEVEHGVLMVKFDRATVAGWFEGLHDVGVVLTVAGDVDGVAFEGTDTIRVIDPSQRRGGR